MYALAINGSPRKGGNTEIMLETLLQPLSDKGWKTEIYQIGNQKIRGCMACMKCWEKKDLKCAISNDIFNDLFEKMVQADALIIGSPTYFADVSTETKALLDRSGFVALANDYKFAGKIGAAVVALRRVGGIHVFDTINHMFLMSRMIVPGSTYWNLGHGLHPGDVREESPEQMVNLKNLGRTIAWLGETMKANMESFPEADELFSEGA